MPEDREGIARLRKRGGGTMIARDHMDLGSSVCSLANVGATHHFHSRNREADSARWRPDDLRSGAILWPNYHSGANGDFQAVRVVGEPHVVLHDPHAPGGVVRYLPSHPHEGVVSASQNEPRAGVILQGRSLVTGSDFNLAVAFEGSHDTGPAIAQSTFHHFCDYNWDLSAGATSFVRDVPGDGLQEAVRSTKQYALNIALWLAGRSPRAQG